jgi:meso-butanediol dehydrogenase / (S,S)-butanediol dehydrogenase / diacetyl reductase
MSVDERFSDVDWEELLYKLTARARQLFAAAKARGLPVNTVVERFGAAHPLGRLGTVEEIAELAAFLLSNRSTLCTGGDYLVDGGLLAGIGLQ